MKQLCVWNKSYTQRTHNTLAMGFTSRKMHLSVGHACVTHQRGNITRLTANYNAHKIQGVIELYEDCALFKAG